MGWLNLGALILVIFVVFPILVATGAIIMNVFRKKDDWDD